jgi:glycosyltransferase involved in cell wall biosynthesis
VRVCTPHCGLDPGARLGGEVYEREILQALAARGITVDILLARHLRHPEGIPNWVIHRLPIGRGLRWPVAALLLPPFIKRVYEATRFDLLRVHSLRYIGPAALIARRRYALDVPIVAHHHHLDPHWLNPLIERRVMQRSERIVVGSEFARGQAAQTLGVPLEKFSVIPYGVDRRYQPGPKPEALIRRWGLEGKTVALFLGGLHPRKNLFFLLDVWREVTRERDGARLVVVGSGPLLAALRRYARRLGQEQRVIFTGYVPEPEKADYYHLADLLIFPSTMEGFGLTVAEAMSCGLPVVVSNRGSLPELVADGEEGFLVDPFDRQHFAGRTALLLSNPTLRQKFGEASRARADRKFRWEDCAAATARVYEEVLEAWRARRRTAVGSAGA